MSKSISDFITIGVGGVTCATFAEIKESLIDEYKAVYGTDIDLSQGNVDDIWINDLALIINNILRSVSTMYANLDVSSASGKYLESLCRLANIKRKAATCSTAILTIQNNLAVDWGITNNFFVTDPSGNDWRYLESTSLTVPAGASINIKVTCSTPGPIEASAGTLIVPELLNDIIITQPNDAIVGTDAESDSELRARRARAVGSAGETTLDSLVGALLEIAEVEDVYIYNNNTALSSSALPDNRVVDAHSVYVIVRRAHPNTSSYTPDVADKQIASTIYAKLTPGIATDTIAGKDTDDGLARTIDITTIKDGLASISVLSTIDFDVRWKQATPVHPKIEIPFTEGPNFNENEIDTAYQKELLLYLNKLPIGTNLTRQNLLIEVLDLDPYFNGRATYSVDLSTIKIGGNSSDYTNKLTYYDYSSVSYDTSTTPHKLIIS